MRDLQKKWEPIRFFMQKAVELKQEQMKQQNTALKMAKEVRCHCACTWGKHRDEWGSGKQSGYSPTTGST